MKVVDRLSLPSLDACCLYDSSISNVRSFYSGLYHKLHIVTLSVFWTKEDLTLLHSWWLFPCPCWINGTTLFYSLCAVSCVFKVSYFSEWYISASPFEASTVKTSYANYAQCLTHQRTPLHEKWNSHTHRHTHPCPPLCYILLGAMGLRLQQRDGGLWSHPDPWHVIPSLWHLASPPLILILWAQESPNFFSPYIYLDELLIMLVESERFNGF